MPLPIALRACHSVRVRVCEQCWRWRDSSVTVWDSPRRSGSRVRSLMCARPLLTQTRPTVGWSSVRAGVASPTLPDYRRTLHHRTTSKYQDVPNVEDRRPPLAWHGPGAQPFHSFTHSIFTLPRRARARRASPLNRSPSRLSLSSRGVRIRMRDVKRVKRVC